MSHTVGPDSSGPEERVTIGVEMEVFADFFPLRWRLTRLIPDIVGPPVHEGGASFACDRSVHRIQKRATEIRTPVMHGLGHALDLVGRLVEALARTQEPMPCMRDVRVIPWIDPDDLVNSVTRLTSQCGLHVHVGVPPTVTWLDGLAAVLDAWLPVQSQMIAEAYGPQWWNSPGWSRRSCWCGPWFESSVLDAAACKDPQQHRFHAWNPMAIQKHHTVEYRFWPMSLDPERVKHAIRVSVAHAVSLDWESIRNGETRRRIEGIYQWTKAAREEAHRRFDEMVMAEYRRIQRERATEGGSHSYGRRSRRRSASP